MDGQTREIRYNSKQELSINSVTKLSVQAGILFKGKQVIGARQ